MPVTLLRSDPLDVENSLMLGKTVSEVALETGFSLEFVESIKSDLDFLIWDSENYEIEDD